MRTLRCLALAVAATLGAMNLAPSVHAQSVEIGPGGLRIDPYDRGYDRGYYPGYEWDRDDRGRGWDRDRRGTSRWEAIRAARLVGLIDVDGISRRGPHWVIEGSDRRGRDMRVTVHWRHGRVIDIDRY